ncbi:MAG TPA: hypothetical protein VMZ22_10365 [Acidimicrobiales bacterium]|nr:hypothetical protein [Acidimicrobiales bacterium]
MTTVETNGPARGFRDGEVRQSPRYEEELDTETRRSVVTSEFWLLLIGSVTMLFFAYDDGGDSFARDDAWRYVTFVTVAYLLSRGLAKAGSYESFRRPR